MRVLDAGARERSVAADLDPGSMLARLDPAMVEEKAAHSPAGFQLRARNPARDLNVGGNRVNFGSVGGRASY